MIFVSQLYVRLNFYLYGIELLLWRPARGCSQFSVPLIKVIDNFEYCDLTDSLVGQHFYGDIVFSTAWVYAMPNAIVDECAIAAGCI